MFNTTDLRRVFQFVLASLVVQMSGNTSNALAAVSMQEMNQAEQTLVPAMELPSAVQFPVVINSFIGSKSALKGDIVKATLLEDLMFEDRLVAPQGSLVYGHVTDVAHAKTRASAAVSAKVKKNALVHVVLEEIVTPSGHKIPIEGKFSKQTNAVEDFDHIKHIQVDQHGNLIEAEEVLDLEKQASSQILKLGLNSSLGIGVIGSFGILPAVMGVVGASDPSIITGKPVPEDAKHPRIGGFALGLIDSLPASFVLEDMILKGSEIKLEAGDRLLVQAHSPYIEGVPHWQLSQVTRATSTSAQILPKNKAGASSSVHTQTEGTDTVSVVSRDNRNNSGSLKIAAAPESSSRRTNAFKRQDYPTINPKLQRNIYGGTDEDPLGFWH